MICWFRITDWLWPFTALYLTVDDVVGSDNFAWWLWPTPSQAGWLYPQVGWVCRPVQELTNSWFHSSTV